MITRRLERWLAWALCLHLFALTTPLRAEPPDRLEFTRMVAHWAGYGGPEYLPFIDAAQPELVQLGFYGGHFWSLAHTPQFGGYPAHFPVQGLSECGNWFEARNRELHQRQIKVVGHFNVEFLVGDPDGPEGPRGFFKFYRELWDEKKLGPKPVADPIELLERGPDGQPIVNESYSIGGMKEYWACLRNPGWQRVLKAWVRHGVERGLDGFIANYFYRHNCLCEHCQSGFRTYLSERFTTGDLRDRFGIADVAAHKFKEIVYWHNPAETTPLRLEMLRFSQISNKQVFDKVFIEHGRSLKPDLIVAQWNHLGNFGQISGDERCLLPADLWGKDESYLWYSTGGSAHYTDLENRYLGEGTLQARYIRGAFDDKPFTLGKYENTRTRVSIAELAANGGAPMGFYARLTSPEAREVFAAYYGFLRRHDALYRAARPHAEAVLLFPRSKVHQGNIEPVAKFRELGAALLDAHVLFDVLPDDLATPERLAAYKQVFTTDKPEQASAEPPATFSRFDAPYTVRISASRPAHGNDLVLHFVNYNREEPPKDNQGNPSAGGGTQDEKPIPVSDLQSEVVIPPGFQVQSVAVCSPEAPDPVSLDHKVTGQRLTFTMPEFLVYGVAVVKLVGGK